MHAPPPPPCHSYVATELLHSSLFKRFPFLAQKRHLSPTINSFYLRTGCPLSHQLPAHALTGACGCSIVYPSCRHQIIVWASGPHFYLFLQLVPLHDGGDCNDPYPYPSRQHYHLSMFHRPLFCMASKSPAPPEKLFLAMHCPSASRYIVMRTRFIK